MAVPTHPDEVPYATSRTDLAATPKAWLIGEVIRLRRLLDDCWEAAGLLNPSFTGQYEQAWEQPSDLVDQIEELCSDARHCRENHSED